MEELGHMFGICGAGPRHPWLWIIEYLSSFQQIEIPIILDLIEVAPVLPEALGKKTSEMLAFRILEMLFGPGNGPENVAPLDSRVACDLSLSCEDVLELILQEVPLSNLRNAQELLSWDVHSFIMHKRANLPKCELEKLKDSISRQMSVLDGNENVPTSRFNESDDENGNQEGNLIPQIHENDNEALQDGLLERNILPAKRFRDDLVAGNLLRLVSDKQDGKHNNLHMNTNKFKKDANPICSIQSDKQIPIHLHGEEQLEEESAMITKVTEIEGNNSGNDCQVGEGDQDGHVAPGILGPSGAVGYLDMQDNQMEDFQNAEGDVIVEQKYGDRPCQNVMMDESNYGENCALQKGPSGDAGHTSDRGLPLSSPNSTSTYGLLKNTGSAEAKADMDHPCAEQICENEDGGFNNASKKSLFLSSQCTQSQDPVGKARLMDQHFCVKCNQNGQVLVCSSSGCSLVVHESCLDSAARFHDNGNFYCPFCAYSVSMSKYLEAKEKTSFSWNKIAKFLGICSKKHTGKLRKLKNGHLGGREDNLSQNREVNHGPFVSCLNGSKLCAEEEASMGGAVDVQGKNIEEEEKVIHVYQVAAERINPPQTTVNNDGDESGIFPPQMLVDGGGEESSGDTTDKYIISSYSTRFQKRNTK